MFSDNSFGLQRPMLHDDDLGRDAASASSAAGSVASIALRPSKVCNNNNDGDGGCSGAIFFSSSFHSPAPSMPRSALNDTDGDGDGSDEGFLLGFGAGTVAAEDAHEAEYVAADSQKILFGYDDHGADFRSERQLRREQKRAIAALERSARQYRERVDAVLRGKHLVTVDQAVELAGLQIQIEFGEYIRPGAIELGLVLPQRYLGAKGVEAKCFAAHAKVRDMTDAEAREQYTTVCRATRTYGALHTTMHEKIRGKSKRVTRIVGVTRKDLLCIEPSTHEIAATYALSSIRRWATNDTPTPSSYSSPSPSPSTSTLPPSSDAAAASADGPGSLTIWLGNGATDGTVLRFESKRHAAASAAEALLITALKSSRTVRHSHSHPSFAAALSPSALTATSPGYSEEGEYATDEGFHSPSSFSSSSSQSQSGTSAQQQQRMRRRASSAAARRRRCAEQTPTSDYASTPEGTPELQRKRHHHRRPSTSSPHSLSSFELAAPSASDINRRRSMARAATNSPARIESSSPSVRAVASTKGDAITYTPLSPSPPSSQSPSPQASESGRASTTSLTAKNRRWSTASIESAGVGGTGGGASSGRTESTSPPNRWSWPMQAAPTNGDSGSGPASLGKLPRTSPLRHSISASDRALNSNAGACAVPRRRASTSLVVEVVPTPKPSVDGDRASGGAVYDLLRSEMSRLRSDASHAGDFI